MGLKNLAILTGYVGQDPEIKHISDNVQVASFSLATTEYFKGDGDRKQDTQWHNIVAWNRLAEFCGKYVTKGMLLQVMGSIKYRTYETKEGAKRYVTEIVAEKVEFVGKKETRQGDTGNDLTY